MAARAPTGTIAGHLVRTPAVPAAESVVIPLLNGLAAGLLLLLLSAGLTLIYGLMGVLNFAHAAFYLLGAYVAAALAGWVGFWPALALAPLLVGMLGAWFQARLLGPAQRHGHLQELLLTFGAGVVIVEAVQLVWGRAPVPFDPPALLRGAAFTLVRSTDGSLGLVVGEAPPELCRALAEAVVPCARFPASRAFIMVVALVLLGGLGLVFARTRAGLVIQAALTHPAMVQALGHDLPRLRAQVFGLGCALAALAGVIYGVTFVTEPGMAHVGALVFAVVVVGGLGSLAGAALASLLVGLLQTLPLAWDTPLGLPGALAGLSAAQLAPLAPYLLLMAVLAWRPRGLLGRRDG